MSFFSFLLRLSVIVFALLPVRSFAVAELVSLLSRTQLIVPNVQLAPQSEQWLERHAQIKVGIWSPAHPPFVVDADPLTFEGLSADYLAVIGQALGKNLELIKFKDKPRAIAALRSGEVDILPWFRPLPGEDNDILLSTPYQQDYAVLVHHPSLLLNNNDELENKTLIYSGDPQLKTILETAWPKAKVNEVPNNFIAIGAVAHNENMVMWGNDITAKEINRRLYDNSLGIVPGRVNANQNLAFAVLKKNAPLIEAINLILNSLPLQTRNLIAQTWQLDDDAGSHNEKLNLDAKQQAWLKNHPTVSVLIVNSHIPLTFKEQNGKTSGMTIALLDKISQRSGLKFTYQNFTNLAQMRAQLIKQPDALIAVADASARQSRDISYSRPYLISNWVLVTRNNMSTVSSLADMAGKNIAVFTGSYYLDELREQYPQVNFEETDFSVETVFSFWTHNLDAAIIPQNAASFFMKTFFADHFRIASTLTLPPLRLSMATGIDNSTLLSIINKVLIDIPPQSIDAQLSSWQMNHALARYNLWSQYRDYLLVGSLAIMSLLALFLWRNAFLKRNLLKLEKMQAELELARARAEKANKSKSTFLAQMSHEIRTPLNALIGLLELENRGDSTPALRANNIAVAYDSAKSLLLLVGDILDLAKIESGTLSVKKVPVSLPEVISTVCTLFRYAAAEKNLTLTTSLELRDSTIIFDPVMLKQIASNLLSNAIKFTSQGEIEVALYQAKDLTDCRAHYVLEVCDSGAGLTEEQQSAIFEPFVQVDEQLATHNGTGLGLSICRQLAQLLGGKLSVESEPGEGSTFLFSFSAQVCKAIPPLATPHESRVNSESRNILIVDDHAPNRLLLMQQLEFGGHRVVAVENGEQALTTWTSSSTPFDVVITDCNMPKITGFELIKRLRTLERQAGSRPISMFGLTAMAEQEITVRAEEAGMTECLFKPVELNQLLTKIAQAFQQEGHKTSAWHPVVLTLNKLAHANPAAFRDLIETVISQNKADIHALQQSVKRLDFDNVKYTAHNMLGGAKLINAIELEQISEEIERVAETRNIQSLLILVEKCREVSEALEKHLTHELR